MQTLLRKEIPSPPIKFVKCPVGLMGGWVEADHLHWAAHPTLPPTPNLIRLSITISSVIHFSQLPDQCFVSTKLSKWMTD